MDERKVMKLMWVLVLIMNLIAGIKGVAGDMENWEIAVHAFLAVFAFFILLGYRKKDPMTHDRKAVYEYVDKRTAG